MKKRILKIILIILVFIVIYLCFVCLPYLKQPKPDSKTIAAFDTASFYKDHPGPERATILSDNGDALIERLRLISHAKERIILSTFDFMADNSGKLMLGALADAAQRGVEVCILTDGFPYFAHMMGNPYFYAVASLENVTFKVYNPIHLFLPHRLMARMHDKYLIADSATYILGGRNTYDFFLGTDTDYVNYDWDVLVSSSGVSPSLAQLEQYFTSVWEHSASKVKMDSVPFYHRKSVAQSRAELAALYANCQKEHPDWFTKTDYVEMTVPTNNISLLSNPIEPSVKEPVLFYQMTELMKQSKDPVYFHTPYILCSDYMMQRLAEVCKEPHAVTMMTNSVANNGNPFGATDYHLHKPQIIDTGLQILEYDSGVSYHGKCFTIGNRLSGIGSFNWDMRSAYLDTELMLVIDSPELSSMLRKEMQVYETAALSVKDAETYDLKDGQQPQPLKKKNATRISLLTPLNRWIRYLL